MRNVAYHPGGTSNGDLALGLSAGLRAFRKSRIAPQISAGAGAFDFSLSGEALIPGDPICDPAAISSANAAPRSLFRSLSVGGSNSILIISPSDGQSFSLTDADLTATTLSFLANVSSGSSSQQAISWTAALKYQPSQGSFGPYTDNRTLNSVSGSPVTSTYTGLGGQLKVIAKAQTCSSSQPATATVTITGNQVPTSDIKNYLLSIYQSDPSMVTPKLLVQIAEDESTLRQFCTIGSDCYSFQRAMYGSNGPWPLEGTFVKPEPGKDPKLRIGLMQVDIAQDTAWNWVKNADAGHQNLDDKFSYVRQQVNKIRKSGPGLRDLTPYEYENMALTQYGESPGKKYINFYYVASCNGEEADYSQDDPACPGNKWDWTTTTDNPRGVHYVSKVRNQQ